MDLGLGLGPTSPIILMPEGAPPAYSSEAEALFAAFSVQPSSDRKALIDETIAALIEAGVWAKADQLLVLAAHTSQAALLNWVAPEDFVPTLEGTPAPSFEADIGFTTNGSSNYIDTKFNPATAGGLYSQNSASFAIWNRLDGTSASSAAGWFDGTDGTTLSNRDSSSRFTGRINQAAASQTGNGAVANGIGLFSANRSGASATQFYHNGQALTISSGPNAASTDLNSATFSLGRITASAFRAMTFRASFIGASLTAQEHADLYTILAAYMAEMGD